MGLVDEYRSACLTSLPNDGTYTASWTISGNRTVTVTQIVTKVTGKNMTRIQLTASWPEIRGSRAFNDTMSFECYMRGPDNAS